MVFFDLPLLRQGLLRRALVAGVAASSLGLAAPAERAAWAQGQSPSAQRAQSYVLGSGDQIRIAVKDFPEFNVDNVVVPPDGLVSLPFYGTVRVGGKTTAQVAGTLGQILLRELKQPRVSVAITKFRELTIGRVYLLGTVATPGPVEIREGFRLTELLAAANGLGGRLDEKSATLSRAGQAPIRLDLAGAIASPNGPSNIRLRPDDTIRIEPIKPGEIVVTGDVAQGGRFELHRSPQPGQRELGLAPRLSDAILAAGGFARGGAAGAAGAASTGSDTGAQNVSTSGELNGSNSSNSSNSSNGSNSSGAAAGTAASVGPAFATATRFTGFLQRGGRRVELNVEEALRDVGGIYNIPLQAGDFVTVEAALPPAPIKVYVSGFVGRTGPIQVAPGTTLLQAISEAGGLTRTADKVNASVRRGRSSIAINLAAVQLQADSPANIELEAGDEIRIDEPSVIRVRVSGSVGTQGDLRLRPGSTLIDALTEAGGPSIKAEDARVSVLRREQDGTQKIIGVRDPAALVQVRSVDENITLRDGDLVSVSPIQLQTVTVQGEVNREGPVEVREGEGLVDVIARAGGTKEGAALSRIAVERNGQTLTVDALDALKLGRPLNFPMQKGDRVVVLPNEARVAVLEAVAKPGVYAIPERGRLTLSDALTLAGGPSPSTKEVVLVRSVNGVLQERKFAIRDVRSGAAGQTVLQSHDAIYVPVTVAKRNPLEKLGSAIGLLSIFGR